MKNAYFFIIATIILLVFPSAGWGQQQQWQWENPTPHGDNIYCVKVIPPEGANNNYGQALAVGSAGKILYTNNAGQSWVNVLDPLQTRRAITKLQVVNENLAFALAFNKEEYSNHAEYDEASRNNVIRLTRNGISSPWIAENLMLPLTYEIEPPPATNNERVWLHSELSGIFFDSPTHGYIVGMGSTTTGTEGMIIEFDETKNDGLWGGEQKMWQRIILRDVANNLVNTAGWNFRDIEFIKNENGVYEFGVVVGAGGILRTRKVGGNARYWEKMQIRGTLCGNLGDNNDFYPVNLYDVELYNYTVGINNYKRIGAVAVGGNVDGQGAILSCTWVEENTKTCEPGCNGNRMSHGLWSESPWDYVDHGLGDGEIRDDNLMNHTVDPEIASTSDAYKIQRLEKNFFGVSANSRLNPTKIYAVGHFGSIISSVIRPSCSPYIGQEWNLEDHHIAGADDRLIGIAVGDLSSSQKFIITAGGHGALLYKHGTSPWVQARSGPTRDFNKVCYVPEVNGSIARAFAVGEGGIVMRMDPDPTTGASVWQQVGAWGSTLNGISFADANTGVIVGNNGLLYSTRDRGNTWYRYTFGTMSPADKKFIQNINLRDVVMRRTPNGILTGFAVGGKNTLLRYTDGTGGSPGTWIIVTDTWSDPQPLPTSFPPNIPKKESFLSSIAFNESNIGIAVGSTISGRGFLVFTMDNGLTWDLYDRPLFLYNDNSGSCLITGCGVEFNSIASRSGNVFFVVGRALTRCDRPVAPATHLSQLPSGKVWKLDVNSNGPDLFTLTTYNDNTEIEIPEYHRAPNDFDTENFSYFNNVNFATPLVGGIVGENGVILMTTDGGERWVTRVSTARWPLRSIAFAGADTSRSLAVGYWGTILRKTNVFPALAEDGDDEELPFTRQRSDVSFGSPEKDIFLQQNTPNPFTQKTSFSFRIQQPGTVTIKIYNSLGKTVVVLLNEYRQQGEYTEFFDSGELPAGIYFYQMEVNGIKLTRKMSIIK